MTRLDLEDEQIELLRQLVDLSLSMPREERGEFFFIRTLAHSQIQHPRMPGGAMDALEIDIDALRVAGLLRVAPRGQDAAKIWVQPRGFQAMRELLRAKESQIESVETTVSRFVDSELFIGRYPDAHRHWTAANELLWADDAESMGREIGTHCRNAFEAFVTHLVERHGPLGVDDNEAHTRNRIAAVAAAKYEEPSDTVVTLLEALHGAYFIAVNAIVQRQVHEAQGRLGRDDSRRVVFCLLVFMLEADAYLW